MFVEVFDGSVRGVKEGSLSKATKRTMFDSASTVYGDVVVGISGKGCTDCIMVVGLKGDLW